MSEKFDPYHNWLGIRPEEQPPNHYRLLGVQPLEDSLDAIEHAADQRMAHLRTLQTGKHAAACQQLLNQVAAAKVCLLSTEKKVAYDERLRAKLKAAARAATPPPAEAPPQRQSPSQPAAAVWSQLPSTVRARAHARKTKPSAMLPLLLGAAGIGVLVVVGLLIWGGPSGKNPSRHRPKQAAHRGNAKRPPVAEQLPLMEPPEERPTEGAANGPLVEPDPGDPVVQEPPDVEPPAAVEDLSATDSEPPVPAEAVKKLSVPSEAAQAEIVGKLNDLYKFADAQTAGDKLQLAEKLLELAEKFRSSPDERFVALRKAIELAGEGGDAALMLETLDVIAAEFDIEPLSAKQKVLEKFANGATGAKSIESFVTSAPRVIDEALSQRRYDVALNLASLADDVCRQSKNREFRKKYFKQTRERRDEAAQLHEAQTRLDTDPDDGDANGILGRWHAFNQGDWEQGLPYLAKGNDEGLKACAQRELSNPPKDAADQLKLADAWWSLATQSKGEEKAALMRRAGYWYQQAEPQVTSGIDKVKVEQRLQEIAALERPSAEEPGGEPAARPKRKFLPLRTVAKTFGLQPPRWQIEGNYLKSVMSRRGGSSNNPTAAKSVRASSLEYGFKIDIRSRPKWHQRIQLEIDGRLYSYTRGAFFNFREWGTLIEDGEKQIKKQGERIESLGGWSAPAATLKDDTLKFYYNGELQWEGKVPKTRNGKHVVRVGFGSRMATVCVKDFYLEVK